MSKTARRIGIILVFVLGLGYFLFSTLVYNPFEASYMDQFEGTPEVAIEFAIPREVDFMVHKRGLAADYAGGSFPLPDFWNEIRVRKDWRHFADTQLAKDAEASLEIDKRIDEIRSAVEQIPVLDPVADILGRDVAIFGRIKGYGYDHDEAAAIFLGSGMARFAYAATNISLLRSMFGMPVEVTETEDGVIAMKPENGPTLYTLRHLDLMVVSTGPGLVKEVKEMLDSGIEQSLGRSRGYNTTVAQDVSEFAGVKLAAAAKGPSVDRRIQLFGRMPSLQSLTKFDDEMLEPRGDVSRWLLARLFNPRYFQAVTLDIGMGDAIELRGTLGFDRQMAENAKTGFYNRKTFELKKAMDKAARVLPDDTFFLMAARVDMREFFPQLIDGLKEVDPKAVTLIDDLIANVRKIRPDFRSLNAADAARNFASFLGDDVVVAMKRDNYFGAPTEPMPLIAFFFDVTERGPSFEELRKSNGDPSKTRGYNGFVFPIQTAHAQLKSQNASIANWFTVTHGGQNPETQRTIQEVILQGTSGIKNVSFGIVDPANKEQGPWQFVLVLSPHIEKRDVKRDNVLKSEDFGTAQEMITDVIQLSQRTDNSPATFRDASGNTERTVRRLSISAKYTQGSGFLDRFASVAMFVDAVGLKAALADQAEAYADDATAIDWNVETPRLTNQLMDGEFATWKGKPMPEKVKTDFDRKLSEMKEDLDKKRREEKMPAIRAAYEEGLAWVDLFEDAFLAARIDDKEQIIELGARVRTSLK